MNYKNKYKYRDFRKSKAQRTAYIAYLEATKRRRKAVEFENLALCEIETREFERAERQLLKSQKKSLDEKKEPEGSFFLDIFIDLCLKIVFDCYQQQNKYCGYNYKNKF